MEVLQGRKFRDDFPLIAHLAVEHAREVGYDRLPGELSYNLPMRYALEDSGHAVWFLCVEGERPVGYAFFIVGPSRFRDGKTEFDSLMIYLAPEARTHANTKLLWQTCVAAAKARGSYAIARGRWRWTRGRHRIAETCWLFLE